MRSCQGSAWHWSSRILKPLSRPFLVVNPGQENLRTASPHQMSSRTNDGTIWLNYGMWLHRHDQRLQGVEKVTTMATLSRTDALYRRRRKLARSGAYEFFYINVNMTRNVEHDSQMIEEPISRHQTTHANSQPHDSYS